MKLTDHLLELLSDLTKYTIEEFTNKCFSMGMEAVIIPFTSEETFPTRIEVYKDNVLINSSFATDEHIKKYANELNFLRTLYVVDNQGELVLLG